MSVVNLHIAPDHIWLVTDTAMFTPDGRPVSFGTKHTAYQHISALLAWRGALALHRQVDLYLNGMYHLPDGIESALPGLPGYLRRKAEDFLAKHRQHDPLKVAQSWLLGWCSSRRRFGGFVCSSAQDFRLVELDAPSTHINPGNDFAPPPAVLPDPTLLVRIVAAQQQQDAMEPPPTIGGDLILVRLDKHGMTTRKILRLPGYDDLVAQMASPRSAAA